MMDDDGQECEYSDDFFPVQATVNNDNSTQTLQECETALTSQY